ncbi:MAG: phosphotransferase [Proteobacteria bacterium]|nr:phosphotransferase [Pseudomonadota bacterium]
MSTASPAAAPDPSAVHKDTLPSVHWDDPARAAAFERWLAALQPLHGLLPASLRPASADASFRRYLRIDSTVGTSFIVMDAPPAHEDCRPFVKVAGLMREAGLEVPRILAWDEALGFMLLTDLGNHTLLERLDAQQPDAARPLLLQAAELLVAWQRASTPGVLPPYDEALLQRELALFPDWYLARHRGVSLSEAERAQLSQQFDLIVGRCLAAPSVYVHRDFMPRNLMAPRTPGGPLGVLDFQDAVYGPLSYDIASLMRDAFISWDEEFVLDITVRYWERARRAGLMDFEDWHRDFGAFYRAVEWMGLQRHLKVAGIFARLTLRDGKPKYLADAPRFIAYIRATASRYAELAPLLRLIDRAEGQVAASGFAFGRI